MTVVVHPATRGHVLRIPGRKAARSSIGEFYLVMAWAGPVLVLVSLAARRELLSRRGTKDPAST